MLYGFETCCGVLWEGRKWVRGEVLGEGRREVRERRREDRDGFGRRGRSKVFGKGLVNIFGEGDGVGGRGKRFGTGEKERLGSSDLHKCQQQFGSSLPR